jgi:hypothetical protein
MIKSPFFSAHKGQIWPEMRQGEIVLLRAESRTIAKKIPDFAAV